MKHFYIEFPPFSSDSIRILSEEEWTNSDLPANHNYEHVSVGEGGDYTTESDLYAYEEQENDKRREH